MSTLGYRPCITGTGGRQSWNCLASGGGTCGRHRWRCGVSIGNALAEARRQAGLTVTQVSQRTCIRETIIRAIERTDFSACGGDFYARGHIRSIARAVGVDPEPLISEYDLTQDPAPEISAAEVFSPTAPIKMKERRRPNWTAAMAVAVLLIAGIFAYQHFTARPAIIRAGWTSGWPPPRTAGFSSPPPPARPSSAGRYTRAAR